MIVVGAIDMPLINQSGIAIIKPQMAIPEIYAASFENLKKWYSCLESTYTRVSS